MILLGSIVLDTSPSLVLFSLNNKRCIFLPSSNDDLERREISFQGYVNYP
jgi:hypothetical protein